MQATTKCAVFMYYAHFFSRYSTLEAVAAVASRSATESHDENRGSTKPSMSDNDAITTGGLSRSVVLFNGTNADDRTDPTRVGLKAAADFNVASPLDTLTKDEVKSAVPKFANCVDFQ